MTGPIKVYLCYCALVVPAFIILAIGGRRPARRRLLWGGSALLVAGAVALLVRYSEPDNLADDFRKAYYPAGTAVFQNPSALYERDGEQDGNFNFVNIPILALLFTPLSMLPEWTAYTVFTILGVGAVGLAYFGLVRFTGISGWHALALGALIAVNGPLWYSFREGNLTHFVLPLQVGLLCFAVGRRDILAGFCLAIVGLIKMPLILFAVYFLLRRRWRLVAAFSATLLSIVGLSIALFSLELHLAWWRACIDPFAGHALTAYNAQSLHAFLARCMTEGSVVSWQFVDVDRHFGLIHKGIIAGLILATAMVCRRPPSTAADSATEHSLVLCLALIASPLSWTHYFLLLLIPAAVFLGKLPLTPKSIPWFAAIGTGLLLMSPPVLSLTEGLTPWTRALGSHCFFGAMLLTAILLMDRWRSSRPVEIAQGSQAESKHVPERLAA